MSKWDKLLRKICTLSKDLRFDALRKVMESYGLDECPKGWELSLHIQKSRMPTDYDTEA